MPNESNRVLWRLKSEPNAGYANDFKSIIIKDGFVIIETYTDTKKFKYDEILDHIRVWPRAFPGTNPLDIWND